MCHNNLLYVVVVVEVVVVEVVEVVVVEVVVISYAGGPETPPPSITAVEYDADPRPKCLYASSHIT
jgi:hypothetical protein